MTMRECGTTQHNTLVKSNTIGALIPQSVYNSQSNIAEKLYEEGMQKLKSKKDQESLKVDPRFPFRPLLGGSSSRKSRRGSQYECSQALFSEKMKKKSKSRIREESLENEERQQ